MTQYFHWTPMMKILLLRFKSEAQETHQMESSVVIFLTHKKRGRSLGQNKEENRHIHAHTTQVSRHRCLHYGSSASSLVGPKQGPGCPKHPQRCHWPAYADRLSRPVL